jgi:phospholipid/cholesterol/gamma-HCH transport system ATP-binding protein
MPDNCVIELRGVWTRIGAAIIHRDINLCVRSGQVLGVIGESGSGKSMLLRLMLGLGQPSRGTVRVFDRPLQGCGADDMKVIRRRWGVLFQQGALFSALSVYDNVALPLRELRALPEDVIRELVMTKLALVEIDVASADKLPSQLSGGMVKRVALARAMALDPELLFLDEPTAGLDPERAAGFVKLIEMLRQELHLTVVMVTHDVDTLIVLADRVAVLADQRLVTVGSLSDVMEFPHRFVHSFFLGHRISWAPQGADDFRRAPAPNRQAA